MKIRCWIWKRFFSSSRFECAKGIESGKNFYQGTTAAVGGVGAHALGMNLSGIDDIVLKNISKTLRVTGIAAICGSISSLATDLVIFFDVF